MTHDNVRVQYHEGSPWFWKIFGSAITGLISILLLSHFQNINYNIDRATLDLKGENKELRSMIDAQKEKILNLEQFKDKIVGVEKNIVSLQSFLEESKQKIVALDIQINSLKEDMKSIKESNKDITKQIQETREKIASDVSKKQSSP
jgi:chromosome segregation ATPase